MIAITNHAKKRIKQRCGIKKKALPDHIHKVFTQGFKHCDAKGRARRYLDGIFLKYGKANNMRVYGNFIYLTNNNTLITLVPLPRNMRGGFKV